MLRPCLGGRGGARRVGWVVGVAGLVLCAWPATAVATSVVPLTMNCWAEAWAPPNVSDAGWNHARAVGNYEGNPWLAELTCTNQPGGTVHIVGYEDTEAMHMGDGHVWSNSPDSTLQVGTSPAFPAGAPLMLNIHVVLSTESGYGGGYFRLYRGPDVALNGTFDGQYMSFDAAVPVLAGEALRPTLDWVHPHSPSGAVLIDVTATPEPTAAALLAVGLLVLRPACKGRQAVRGM